MAETSDQILAHIDRQRDRLGADIEQLEMRIREEADWHTHYRRHTTAFLLASLLAGALVAGILIPRRR